MHPLKALRRASVDLLSEAGLSVIVGGNTREVAVLEQPPMGGAVPDDILPALYCYVRSERIDSDSTRTDRRTVLLDFVLQASGTDQDALDQIDDIQLALEREIARRTAAEVQVLELTKAAEEAGARSSTSTANLNRRIREAGLAAADAERALASEKLARASESQAASERESGLNAQIESLSALLDSEREQRAELNEALVAEREKAVAAEAQIKSLTRQLEDASDEVESLQADLEAAQQVQETPGSQE